MPHLPPCVPLQPGFSLAAAVQGRPSMDERSWVADGGESQSGTGQEGWRAGQRGNPSAGLGFWWFSAHETLRAIFPSASPSPNPELVWGLTQRSPSSFWHLQCTLGSLPRPYPSWGGVCKEPTGLHRVAVASKEKFGRVVIISQWAHGEMCLSREVCAIPPESENPMFRGQRSHDAGAVHSLQTPGKLLEPSAPLPLR